MGPHCAQYTAVGDTLAITGNLVSVSNSKFDFRHSHRELGPNPEYDLNYCIDGDAETDQRGLRLAASLKVSDLEMRVHTDAPGIQLYSGCGIDSAKAQWMVRGKDGATYQRYGAVCLETQNWPDAVNHPQWNHDSILRPGET